MVWQHYFFHLHSPVKRYFAGSHLCRIMYYDQFVYDCAVCRGRPFIALAPQRHRPIVVFIGACALYIMKPPFQPVTKQHFHPHVTPLGLMKRRACTRPCCSSQLPRFRIFLLCLMLQLQLCRRALGAPFPDQYLPLLLLARDLRPVSSVAIGVRLIRGALRAGPSES
jgi:hypothetical protein